MNLWNLPNDSDDEQFGAIINAVAAATRQQRDELDAILLELDDDLASQLEAAMQSAEAATIAAAFTQGAEYARSVVAA